MKLSASLYSTKSASILDSVKELEPFEVDYWHIDSIDNTSVFSDIDQIATISNTPIDLHLISTNPAEFYPYLKREFIRRISFQIESLPSDFVFPKIEDKHIGIAIHIGHPEIDSIIKKYEAGIDFVLLMMTTPGISGGKFETEYFGSIRRVVRQFPQMHWCVDGGVNHEISYILRLIGIQSIVVGSYLMQHENMAQAILNIRSTRVHSDCRLSDFQIPYNELPICRKQDNILKMLQIMELYKLGLVFYVDEKNQLLGIISNADIRRVLIEGKFSYELPIENFVNPHPKTIFAHQSTREMIDYIDSIPFPILVLPTIDEKGTLLGAISFHKLLKEE